MSKHKGTSSDGTLVGINSDQAARDYVRQAEKKLQGGPLSFIFGPPDPDEACRLYGLAINKFKMNKSWAEAADCLLRCAALQEKARDSNQQANYYNEAATLFKKYSTKDALDYFEKATDIYTSLGRFNQAGKLMRGCAELLDEDCAPNDSMKYYKRAAFCHEMDEHGKSQYSHCIIKYAELSAKVTDKYSEAIQIFEKEGEKALRNDLIQFGAKEHFLKAGILHLVKGDSVDCKLAYDHYAGIDPRFQGSREGKLYRTLVDAVEQQDIDAFTAAVHEYNTISPFDAWKVHFLHKVKTNLSGGTDAAAMTIAHIAAGAEKSADIDLT